MFPAVAEELRFVEIGEFLVTINTRLDVGDTLLVVPRSELEPVVHPVETHVFHTLGCSVRPAGELVEVVVGRVRCLQQVEEDVGQILVEIDSLSQITVNKREVSDNAIRANLERERAQQPKAPLIIASHPDANTNSLVTVLDAANIIGIDNISVATTR